MQLEAEMFFGLLIPPVKGFGARYRHRVDMSHEPASPRRRTLLILHWYRGPEGFAESHWERAP
jgi:hypothetical protein